MNTQVIEWLLEDSNPAVRYRTQTEILGEAADKAPVIAWLQKSMSADSYIRQQGIFKHCVTAYAECGLSKEDIPPETEEIVRFGHTHTFDGGCGDYLHLRALVRLGLADAPEISEIIAQLSERQLPDGGFLCLHRLDKLKYVPKSCVKVNMAALLFCAECRKKGIKAGIEDALLDYFWNHNLFYRTNDPSTLILNAREGWRSIDTFYPFEVMRVGLQNIVEALCALGYGNDARMHEAWAILNSKKDKSGRYVLDGVLSKSYLPKERVGKPSKWVTFYALLAEKEAAPEAGAL